MYAYVRYVCCSWSTPQSLWLSMALIRHIITQDRWTALWRLLSQKQTSLVTDVSTKDCSGCHSDSDCGLGFNVHICEYISVCVCIYTHYAAVRVNHARLCMNIGSVLNSTKQQLLSRHENNKFLSKVHLISERPFSGGTGINLFVIWIYNQAICI